MRLDVHAHRSPRGVLHIRTNLGELDPCELPAAIGALAAHLDLDVEELRKAVTPKGGEGPDPRYPALTTLIGQARRDWLRYGLKLVQDVERLLEAGKLLPLTPVNEALLLELFRDHHVKITARFSGHALDYPRLEALIARGLVEAPAENPALLEVAFRLGRGLDMLEAHRVKAPGAPTMAHILREALDQPPLTEREQQALAYVRRRGECYMRRPAEQATAGVQRALNAAEVRAFQAVTARAVAERQGHRELARALRDAAAQVAPHPPGDRAAVRELGASAVAPEVQKAMAARTLQNDMDRVARTELAFAHSFGAYEKLRAQAAGAGIDRVKVYKFVSPRACHDCKRIWGDPRKPIVYDLPYIEEREANGGNFQLPHEEWGPTIGPIHPNCTEGPLQLYTEKLVRAINEAADELLATFGRK